MTANKNRNRTPEYVAGGLAALIMGGGIAAVAGSAVAAHEIRQEAAVAMDHHNYGRVALLNEQLADKRDDAVNYAGRAGAILLLEGVIVVGAVGTRRHPEVIETPAQPERVTVMDTYFDELAANQARALQAV
jgi:hypothetical protein